MFTLPDLPYDYKALEPYIDEETMHLHHDKHHATYIKNLNDAVHDGLKDLNLPPIKDLPKAETEADVYNLLQNLHKLPEAIRAKVRNNAGGHANHSFFWEIMCSPSESGQPDGQFVEAINSSFESLDVFKEKFMASALGRFGSGWVWLINNSGKLEIIDTPNQDNPWMENKTPILGLDVWEHAYYLKYKNVRKDYIDAWWNVVNWKKVSELYSSK